MPERPRTLIATATYNEIENLPNLVEEIRRYAGNLEILVIDDNSPDGTGRWCDEHATVDSRFHVVHRPGKQGLGTATIAGMRYAVEHGFDQLLFMDTDFSHHPRYIPDLLDGMATSGESPGADVMIGSRYVPGGGVQGWPWRRRWMSRAINAYARWWLGLQPRDCSGAFRCFRTELLRRIDFDAVWSRGYSFQEEVLWHLQRAGARFGETPITFADRQLGKSKINLREAAAALWILFRLGLRRGGPA
jgi:dolichol-phosphate mannosyltransferase